MLVGIFGTGRNGSTLLMRLLDSSPDLWVCPLEWNFLSAFGYLNRRLSTAALRQLLRGSPTRTDASRQRFYDVHFRRWVGDRLAELRGTYVEKLSEPLLVRNDVHQAIARGMTGSVADDMVAILGSLQAAYDDREHATEPLLTFKSIEVQRLPEYVRLFPTMRFVHIVRSPITTFESLKRTDMLLKQKPFWFQGGDILRTQIEDRWLPHVRFILKHQSADQERHYLVRYEDLTRDPMGIVAGICRWLGVAAPAHPGLQTVLGGKTMAELPANASQHGIKTPAHVVANMAKEYGYEGVITGREREWIVYRTRDLAARVGYADASETAPAPSRLALLRDWWRVDEWERKNARSRLQIIPHVVRRRFYILSGLVFG